MVDLCAARDRAEDARSFCALPESANSELAAAAPLAVSPERLATNKAVLLGDELVRVLAENVSRSHTRCPHAAPCLQDLVEAALRSTRRKANAAAFYITTVVTPCWVEGESIGSHVICPSQCVHVDEARGDGQPSAIHDAVRDVLHAERRADGDDQALAHCVVRSEGWRARAVDDRASDEEEVH